MKVVFLGTAGFAVPALRAVSGNTVAVISRPDRPAGRGRKLRRPPVAEEAEKLGLQLMQPEKLVEIMDQVKEIGPDVMVSAAYGGWLPVWFLDLAPLGVVNIHPSLLPRHRGAAPVIRSVLQGDDTTGVSFMLTDQGWDTGDLLDVYEHPVGKNVTAGELEGELAELAALKLPDVLLSYKAGELPPFPQMGPASYAEKVTPEESEIDWSLSAGKLHNTVRAYNPVPGARTFFAGNMIKIHRTLAAVETGTPGEVICLNPVTIACGEGSLVVLELQPMGKRVMTGEEFARGYRLQEGSILG